MRLNKINVNEIKGISEKMISYLNSLTIHTVADLFNYFPYRYENYEVVNIHTALDNEKITVVGVVVTEPVFSYLRRNLSRLSFSISVEDVILKVTAFNRDFLRGKIKKDMVVTITGKLEKSKANIVAQELKLSKLSDDRIEPVYTLKEMQRHFFLNIMKKAIEQFSAFIDDDLPLALINKYRLISAKDVYTFAHFPMNNEQVKQVQRRVKYEELFKFQLKVMYLKDKDHKINVKEAKVFDEVKIKAFINKLPFELTTDQTKVSEDILTDMKNNYQMNRLLQGDVGSGKTVVAAIALYANYLSAYQGSMMAPTEILAEQHFKYLNQVFSAYNIRIALLTSSITGKARTSILEELRQGKIDILVGTHALISEGVDFLKLGLIIVDEQHRFGVNQRKLLREKGQNPDMLFLSATPIPRTLALTAFGDMEVSSIKQMPKGRKSIKTYIIRSQLENRLIHFIDETIANAQQVYIITPLIEESEKMDLENAVDVYEKYQALFIDKYRIGLLHGRMSNTEKEEVMQQFKCNQIQILVSTTVVEVGVDVPNATLMVIIDAHRFGLAQLHQLRGRVGRGDKQSYCILVSDYQSEKSQNRLEILTKTNDGFEIAEEDLRLRGPGDFFGSKQSGLPEFKMANLIDDYKILEVAQGDAAMIVKTKELWSNPEYFSLLQYIEHELIQNNEFFD